ncbi:hypothetical protein ACFOWA_09270 [Pedobacter lithocola]|uniref:DUF4025 domain-containing protein n=1 Tax=Pedobacter lithocola TaxID=1908239 RepID=A0ABV8PB19_9SPHI
MENQDYNFTEEQETTAIEDKLDSLNAHEPDPKDKEDEDDSEYADDEIEYADGEGTLLNEEFSEEKEDEEQ